MSHQRLVISFLFSLGIHLILLAYSSEWKASKVRIENVEVSIVKEPVKKVPQKRSLKKKRSAPTQSPRLAVKDFLPNYKVFEHTPSVQGLNNDVLKGASAASFDEPSSYGISLEQMVKTNAHFSFLENTYQRIDGHLIYPYLFAEYGHRGIVYIEFEVDRRGVLLPNTLRVSAKNRLLQYHSLQVLREALKDPLKKSLWFYEKKRMKIQSRFIYEMNKGTADKRPSVKISGYRLSFYRKTAQRRVPTILMKHLMQGGIDYNPYRLYESWQKFLTKRRRVEKKLIFLSR